MAAMDLTILICTWNNAKHLKTTLDTIAACTIPAGLTWEMIVVANQCSDGTQKVVEGFSGRLPIRCLHEPQLGKSRALNLGINSSAGKWILFADDDIKPYPDWIKNYWEAMQRKPEGHFFGGSIESEYEAAKPDPEILPFAPFSVKGMDLGREERTLNENEMFVGANWACRKDILAKLHGFDTDKGLNATPGQVKVGEERDMMERLREAGQIPHYLPGVPVRHFVPAGKCTIKHIVSRMEASAFNSASDMMASYPGPCLAGVPYWMYKKFAIAYLHWLKSQCLGRSTPVKYLNYRRTLGQIKGARAEFKKKKRGDNGHSEDSLVKHFHDETV